MRSIVVITFVCLVGLTPAYAQDDSEVEEGFSLMEEGARLLMRGLMSEMEPAISDLRGSLEQFAPVIGEFVREMGPALTDILRQVDDFSYYQAPEFQPNGDIIIRRKPDAPVWIPEDPTAEIEL